MNKQQLAAKIWASANEMRSKIEANEYKDYILGFIFYKFLSDKEEETYYENGGTKEDIKDSLSEEDRDAVRFFQQKIGYFISYSNLFSTWLANSSNFDVSNVSDALNAFNRLIDPHYKRVYEKIFDTLQTGLSKLGDNSGSQTKAIVKLIQLIKDIPMDDRQGYDVLGFIYEYLISMFAANAGKKAGEFYTPHEVSILMSEIVAHHLKDRETIDIYDPTSGSGSLLINIGKAVSKYMSDKDHIKYYAQELKENTYSLTRMNLVMRGILPSNIIARNGDTLEDDWPYFDESDKENTYHPLYVDAVVSNPPYSQHWDPEGKENDARFVNYGLAPKSKADYAFLLHDLFHLKPDGIMTIVLPHGVLFRGGEEEKIRKNLIEFNNIDTIIGLPANIFFGTGIPTIIMVLRKDKLSSDVLIIDASKGFEKSGKSNKLRSRDIKKIVDCYTSRTSEPGFSKLVSREEIRANGYNLNIPRYVDSSEKPEQWDIYSTVFGGVPNDEIDSFAEFWNAFPSLRNELFEKSNDHDSKLKTDDVQKVIDANADVKSFKTKFNQAFEGFDNYLSAELIDNVLAIDQQKEEAKITSEVFRRLSGAKLIDKYEAYQIIDDQWSSVSSDIEIIKTEGLEAIKQVDPKIVAKKQNGKTIEVQEGWMGHILPFDLVQKHKFAGDLESISQLEDKVSELDSELSELFDSVPEDNKDDDCLDNDNGQFVPKAITSKAKELKKTSKSSYDDFDKIVIDVSNIFAEQKNLNKTIKELKNSIDAKTITAIKEMSDNEIKSMLFHKWIEPLIDNINSLPDSVLKGFISKIKKLSTKYSDTLSSLEDQIEKEEKAILPMLDDLDADEYDLAGLKEIKLLLGGKNE